MKKVQIILFTLLCLLFISGRSQNAPVTKVGSITNAVPGTVSIPVTVSNFINIGSITLTLDYDPAVLTFQSATPNAALTGMLVTAGTPGRILIGWYGTGGVTLPEMAHIADITFTYSSGSSSLTWYDAGATCEYLNFGSFVPLNDQPASSYYLNGIVTNHVAPVTTAPVITNVSGSTVTVPVTVSNFSNIGQISLTLEYNPNVLNFQSATANIAFGGLMLVNSLPSTGGKRKIVISYWGSTVSSLPDGSHLVDLLFNYSNLLGSNYSELTWKDDGASCEYADQFNNVLVDSPTADFYNNGLIASQVSPVTTLPTITNAVAGIVNVPVKVTGFNNIKNLSLTFEYNPAVMTYSSNTPNGVFGSSLLVTALNLPNGNKKLVMSWLGSAPVTISDNGTITVLQFTFIAGTTTLNWLDDGSSCEYTDVQNNPLWDSPNAIYYKNGLVSAHAAPRTKAEKIGASLVGGTVSVPLNVWNFVNIGSFSLTLDYDPGVLTYINTTPGPAIGGFLNVGGSTGRILMSWITGSGTLSLADSTPILTLNFTYHGGTSPLNFYDIGETCEYTEGITNAVLYDQPTGNFYINGSVSLATTPLLNTKVFLEGPYSGGSMSTSLKTLNVIPLTQPYSGSPWNYSGIEHVASIPANVTDWILVELRTGTSASTKLATRAGFLKNNGVITDLNGIDLLSFVGLSAGNYYIVIRHRNHMPVMSAGPAPVSSSSALYDFSIGAGQVYGGANGYKNIDPVLLKWGMVAGDASNDGRVFNSDYTDFWVPAFGTINVYNRADFKMDGNVFNSDYTDYWVLNFGKVNLLP